MDSVFNVNDYIYTIHQQQAAENSPEQTYFDYAEILAKVQQEISANHSGELVKVFDTPDADKILKKLILNCLNMQGLINKNISNVSVLVDRLYHDMAGFGVLTKYLQDENVEEVNINAPSCITVQYKDKKEFLPIAFNNDGESINIVKKMARFGGVILDASKPYGDSYISQGIRMSGAIAPCSNNAIASIRKQKKQKISRQDLLNADSALAEELDFLQLCCNHGVSMGISGDTGSGKTADLEFILSTVPREYRVVTIEDTKELALQRFDESGKMINDVVQLYTSEGPNGVTMTDLLRLSLRLNPRILVPAETRGAEALICQEAGRTGKNVLLSLHANSAVEAYDRLLTMCLQAKTNLSEERLLKNIVQAFPIMVFKMQLEDYSRKYMEIVEAIKVEKGEVIINPLYRYVLTSYERNKNGKIIKAHGYHEKLNPVSNKLATKLLLKGADINLLKKYTRSDFSPAADGASR